MTKFICYCWAVYHFTIGVKYEKSKKHSYIAGVLMIIIGLSLSVIIKLFLEDDLYLDKIFIIPLGIYSVIKIAKIFNRKNELNYKFEMAEEVIEEEE